MAYVKKSDQAADDRKIVALYTRVSTGYQIDKDSLPFQKKELTAYCKHILHAEKTELFEDAGKSGKNTDRPAFRRMMKKIHAGEISHVVVYKIDRISRNLVDFSMMYDEFKKYRVTFISLNEQFDTSSAIGEAVLKIILVFAELERKLTSERVTGVMIDRAMSGKWNGARMPFGWKWNPETEFPEHDPVEAEKARTLYRVYDETHSTAKVRDFCYDNDIQTKRGGKWTTTTIINFLKNPMNKGDYRYNYRGSARGTKKPENEVVYVPGVFPPLVDPELWERVNAVIKENGARAQTSANPHIKKHIHVFAGGILKCADCCASFQVSRLDKMRLNGFQPSLYVCTSRRTYRACDAPGASDVIVGAFLFNYIRNLVQATKSRSKIATPDDLERILLSGDEFSRIRCVDPADLDIIYQAIRGTISSGSGVTYIPAPPDSDEKDAPELSGLRAEAARLSRALERLKKAYLFDENALPENEYLSTRADLTEQLTRINNKIADALTDESYSAAAELSFVNSASSFLLSYRLQGADHIVYSDFAASVDRSVLKNFVNMIVDHITIKNGDPVEIVFKNGLRNRFVYQDDATP